MKRKNIFLILCAVMMLFASIFGCTACLRGNETSTSSAIEIRLDKTELNLLEGGSYRLRYALLKNGAEADDAVYTWKSENAAIASVVDGTVTGISEGKTTLTLEAVLSSEKATATVEVNVFKNETLVLSETQITIYSMPKLGEKVFQNTCFVTAELVKKNDHETAGSVVWHSENESVASVDNGKITGCAIGKTNIWATATDANGKTFKSYVRVNVDYPVVEKAIAIVLDKTDGYVQGVSFTDGGSRSVEKILDIQAQKWFNVSNGKVNGNEIESGEREYIVCNNMYGYKLKSVLVADEVIESKDAFENFLVNATQSNTYGKYYVLGGDIDYTGGTLPEADNGNGFAGTFNGCGYSVYNVLKDAKLGTLWNSMFGYVSGTIKNLALYNVEMPFGTDGVLADRLDGATIDNVFIHIKSAGTNDQSGAFCRKVEAGGATIRNSIVWWEGMAYHRFCGLLFGFGEDKAAVNFENSYVIADAQSYRNIVGQRDTLGYQVFRASMAELNDSIIYTYNEFVSDKPFDTTKTTQYWDLESYTIPTMSSAMQRMDIDSFVKIYKTDGEAETAGTAIKASEIAGLVNSERENKTENGYEASGNFTFSIASGLDIAQLYVWNAEIEQYAYDNSNGSITIAAEQLADVGGKGIPFVIRTLDGGIAVYTADIVDYVIASADTLHTLLTTMSKDTTKGKMFALGADIDYQGLSVSDRGHEFAGDFDGRGYTIYNVSANKQFTGLFGNLSGTICNLSLVNVKLSEFGSGLADGLLTGAKIDNVFIRVTEDTATGHHGSIARWPQGNFTISNMVVWHCGSMHANGGLLFGFGSLGAVGGVLENVYVVNESSVRRSIVNTRSDNTGRPEFKAAMEAYDSEVIKTIVEFEQANKTGKFNSYWNTNDYKVYIPQRATAYLSASDRVTIMKSKSIGIYEAVKASDDASRVNVVKNTVSLNLSGKIDGNVTAVYADGQAISTYTYENSVLSVSVADFNGEVELKILSEQLYSATLQVVEYAFTTGTGLSGFLTTISSSDGAENETYGKLYVLASNIDYEGQSTATADNHFYGTFDGRGYTISDIEVTEANGGVFGALYGTVQNVALVNVKLTGATNLGGFADVIKAGSKIDNVFMRVTEDTATGWHGAIARFSEGGSISNTVVWHCGTGNTKGGLLFGMGNAAAASGTTLQNVYVVNETSVRRSIVSTRSDTTSFQTFKAAMEAYDDAVIKTFLEFSATEKSEGFNTYWNKDTYLLYVIKTSFNRLSESDQMSIMQSENIGSVVAVRASDNASRVNVADNVVSLDLSETIGGEIKTVVLNGANVSNYTYENNVLSVSVADLNGDVELKISADKLYSATLRIAEYVFTTADGLTSVLTDMTEANTKGKLYLLGCNIEYGELKSLGVFSGTLDGCGYAIYNATANFSNGGGLFSQLADATIKNLAIMNATSTAGNCGFLADFIVQSSTPTQTTIDNVFIHMQADTNTGHHGAIARVLNNNTVCSISNMVIYYENRTTASSNAGALFGWGQNGCTLNLSNTYVIMPSASNCNLIGQRNVGTTNTMGYLSTTIRDDTTGKYNVIYNTPSACSASLQSDGFGAIWDKSTYAIYVPTNAIACMSESAKSALAK